MILIDTNQVIISAMFAESRGKPTFNKELVRHMVLNTIRKIKVNYRWDYGSPIVLCYDGKDTWRKKVFPYYKANRKTKRDNSDFDWNAFFDFINELRDDIRKHFPYLVLHLDGCEGDDIIATLVKKYRGTGPPILIVSSDSDFNQLIHPKNVHRYDTLKKKLITEGITENDMWLNIAEGDTSDGIPNVLSADDVLVDPLKRQTPLTKKRYSEIFVDQPAEITDELLRNIGRNSTLINFEYIPANITDSILYAYEQESNRVKNKQSNVLEYLVSKNMQNLTANASEF